MMNFITLLESPETDEFITSKRQRSQVWSRFLRKRGAWIGILLLTAISLMAILAPTITKGIDAYHTFIFQFDFHQVAPTFDNFPVGLFGYTSPPFSQSVFSQTVYGARVSLPLGFGAAFIAVILGVVIGAVSGFFGGLTETILMRLTDIFLAAPFLPLVIGVSITMQQVRTPLYFTLLFGFLGWAEIARIVHAEVIVISNKEYIEAARSQGISEFRILVRHALPQTAPIIIVWAALSVSSFILAESTIDFLQIGITTTQTWGTIIFNGVPYILANNWWWITFPGLFIALTVIALNLIGESLRSSIDSGN